MNKKQIIEMLHRNQPEKIQKQGVVFALRERDLNFILEICSDRNYAENCVKIITSLSYDKSYRYFKKLFYLIEDANKIGVDIIVEYLAKAPARLLYDDFLKAVEKDFNIHYDNFKKSFENYFELLNDHAEDDEKFLGEISLKEVLKIQDEFLNTPEYDLKNHLRKENTMYWSLVQILETNRELLSKMKLDNRDFVRELVKDAEANMGVG